MEWNLIRASSRQEQVFHVFHCAKLWEYRRGSTGCFVPIARADKSAPTVGDEATIRLSGRTSLPLRRKWDGIPIGRADKSAQTVGMEQLEMEPPRVCSITEIVGTKKPPGDSGGLLCLLANRMRVLIQQPLRQSPRQPQQLPRPQPQPRQLRRPLRPQPQRLPRSRPLRHSRSRRQLRSSRLP